MTEEQEQEDYEHYIKRLIRGINTIKEEYRLFGFDDFTPIKEKTKTTIGLGKDTWGFKT